MGMADLRTETALWRVGGVECLLPGEAAWCGASGLALGHPLVEFRLEEPPVAAKPEVGNFPPPGKSVDGGGVAVQIVGDLRERHHCGFVHVRRRRRLLPARLADTLLLFFSRAHRDSGHLLARLEPSGCCYKKCEIST